jgi:putative hydrolase of the HAD superfamily
MDNHQMRAVIFDLGNVLVDFDHTIAAKRIAPFSNRSREEIFNLFFDSGITGLFEEGKILPQDFFGKVKDMLNLSIEFQEFLPIWNEIFFLSEKNLALYELAKGLKAHYRLALLSNINVLHFDYIKKNFPVFDAFHHIIASCELKMKKPDPLIYQRALEILDAEPESVFYTDDRPELVETANRLGIRGFVFKDIAQLKQDFLAVGIQIR